MLNLLIPHWEAKATNKAEIYTNFGIYVEAPGWYVERASGDHMLVLHVNGEEWKVLVWNGVDPRIELNSILSLPITEV